MSTSEVFKYLETMVAKGATDLYITVGHPPTLRVENELFFIKREPMEAEDVREVVNSILSNRQLRYFETHMEMNMSIDMGSKGRFRVNIMRQRQMPALVIRRIFSKIPSFDELRLEPLLESLALENRGLILVTGITGSGKSTSLAAMIDKRNSQKSGHIITIEDPIEYFHSHKKSIITQREVGVDTDSFSIALKNALRQRPDVILVGEIRDREVMEQALMVSETGHLCLATLHSSNSYQTIERIVGFFPKESYNQVRLNLSLNLRAIISQRLLPSVQGGMVVAMEIMLNEGHIRDLIHNGHLDKIKDVMEQNSKQGMLTFDMSLIRLYQEGLIDAPTAIQQADKPSDMKMKIQQVDLGEKGSLHRLDTSLLQISDSE